MTRVDAPMREHPDLIEMRDRYERANAKPAAQGIEGVTLLTALYLAISPWVVGFAGIINGFTAITVSNLVTGLVALPVIFGLGAAYGRTHGMAWVVPVIGAWAIVAPWVVQGASPSTDIIVNNAITGGLLVLCGLAAAAVGLRGRSGRGMREAMRQ